MYNHPYIKEVMILEKTLSVLIHMGSRYSLTKRAVNKGSCIRVNKQPLYGIGSTTVPTTTTIGTAEALITVDGVVAGPVTILIVPDGA